jgi:exonuclease SbcC
MRPVKLTISAFGPFADKQVLDLNKLGDKGIYLITGDIGAGKTTLFDAISYALFGKPSGDIREVKMLRSDYADKDTPTFVTLEFVHRNQTYTVTRKPPQLRKSMRKVKGNEYTEGKGDVILTMPDGQIISDNTAVEDKIKEILGVDREQFRKIAMLAQGKFQELLLANTNVRVELFREIFKTHRFQDFQEKVHKAAENFGKEYESLEQAIKQYAGGILCSEDSQYWPQFHAIKAELEKKKKNKEKTNIDWTEVSDLLAKMLVEEEQQVAQAEADLMAKDQDISKLTTRIATAKNQEQARQAIKDGEAKLKELTPKLQENTAKAAEVKKKNQPLIDAQQQKIGQIAQILPDYERLEQLRKQAKTLEKHLAEAKEANAEKERQLGGLQLELAKMQKEEQELADAAAACERLQGEEKNLKERQNKLQKLDTARQEVAKQADALRSAQQAYLDAAGKASKAQEKALAMRTQFNHEQAGLMAEALAEGQPCPVCGSREHPCKAQKSAAAPSEAVVKKAEEDAQEAQKKANEASGKASQCQGSLETAEKALLSQAEELLQVKDKERLAEVLAERLASIKQDIALQKKQLVKEQARQKRWSDLRKQLPEKTNQAKADGEALAKSQNAWTAEQAKHTELVAQATELAGKLAYPDKKAAQREQQTLRAQVEQWQKAIQEAQKSQQDCEQEIAAWNGKIKQSQELLKDAESLDIEAAEKNLQVLTDDKKTLAEKKQQQKTRLDTNRGVQTNIAQKRQESAAVEAKWKWLNALSATVNGDLNGKPGIQLETYYQMSFFDRIIARANRHLMRMSNGKYDLKRSEKYGLRGQTGLELDVIDHYNGGTRSVKSLSGGETFIAALSLALGFSEEIQSNAGGIVLDTMYVDEGFGSLDDESLQQALNALNSLTQGNRLIGIISHVEALRTRLDRQIIVTQAGKGTGFGSQAVVRG